MPNLIGPWTEMLSNGFVPSFLRSALILRRDSLRWTAKTTTSLCLLNYSPKHSIPALVNRLKGVSIRLLRLERRRRIMKVAADVKNGNAGESHMMNKHGNFRFFLPLGYVLALAGVLFAQSTPTTPTSPTKNKTLVVNGKSAGAIVRQIDGRSYVDIQTLAEFTNGAVTIERHRITLTIPPADSGAPATAAPAGAPASTAPAGAAPASTAPTDADSASAPLDADAAPLATAPTDASAAPARTAPAQPPQGLSRDFASAAIAALAEMREMRGAVRAMITYGLSVSDTWAQDDQGRVMTGVRQAEVAATTEDDVHALQLLESEADKLASWSDGVFAARKALNGAMTVDPNALQNDLALAKIRDCGQFLSGMLVSGAFADNPSCH
jgi:hypothetical protein